MDPSVLPRPFLQGGGGGGGGRAEDFLKVIFNSWWNIAEDKKCKL